MFCTEHGSIIAVLYAKFQYDWMTEMDIMVERDFARFEFRADILYCTAPQVPNQNET